MPSTHYSPKQVCMAKNRAGRESLQFIIDPRGFALIKAEYYSVKRLWGSGLKKKKFSAQSLTPLPMHAQQFDLPITVELSAWHWIK